MGLIGTALKAGLAKKIFDEARKPHNQRKIKDMLAKVTDKKSGRSGRTTSGPR